jgi:hypothetical protein
MLMLFFLSWVTRVNLSDGVTAKSRCRYFGRYCASSVLAASSLCIPVFLDYTTEFPSNYMPVNKSPLTMMPGFIPRLAAVIPVAGRRCGSARKL